MGKCLIVDKSILQGTRTEHFRLFVQIHRVILSDVLFYECFTTDIHKKQAVLERCRQAMLAGGSCCPRLSTILYAEARELRPYGPLASAAQSAAFRTIFCRDPRPYDEGVVEEISTEELRFVDYIENYVRTSTEYFRANESKALEAETSRWADINGSRSERFQKWMEFVDSQDLHDVAIMMFAGMTSCPEAFCLSREWITWQFLRVFSIWVMERAFLHQLRGRMKRRDLGHDWADMSYVTFLSRADGLLMHDRFWQDLARVAFPEKDVFSSLKEVPESYRCGWASL